MAINSNEPPEHPTAPTVGSSRPLKTPIAALGIVGLIILTVFVVLLTLGGLGYWLAS